MVGDTKRDALQHYFVSGHFKDFGTHYSPAPENLSWSYVNDGLGLKAYYAYTQALGENSKGNASWDWPSVATKFLGLMEISLPTMPI